MDEWSDGVMDGWMIGWMDSVESKKLCWIRYVSSIKDQRKYREDAL